MSYHQKTVAFIGAASGWGAQYRETEEGPQAIYNAGLLEELNSSDIVTIWAENVRPVRQASEMALTCGQTTLPFVASHAQKLANAVYRALKQDYFPVVIGGDHSIAMGTWGGVTSHYNLEGDFGLLWIDAHMNAHIPATSPSNSYHGMAVAALLGYGEQQLIDIAGPGAKLNPEHIIMLGTRSFEGNEAEFLQQLGVRIYFMEEIQSRGFETVLKEAMERIQSCTSAFGVSIDIDAFDPTEAPGVGSPEAGGLLAKYVIDALHHLRLSPNFKALEITEYNPARDQDGMTAQLIIRLLKELLPR